MNNNKVRQDKNEEKLKSLKSEPNFVLQIKIEKFTESVYCS